MRSPVLCDNERSEHTKLGGVLRVLFIALLNAISSCPPNHFIVDQNARILFTQNCLIFASEQLKFDKIFNFFFASYHSFWAVYFLINYSRKMPMLLMPLCFFVLSFFRSFVLSFFRFNWGSYKTLPLRFSIDEFISPNYSKQIHSAIFSILLLWIFWPDRFMSICLAFNAALTGSKPGEEWSA